MKFDQAIHTIQQQLKQRTPIRLRIPEFIPAAVIIPFFNREGEAHILFTLRTDRVEHHKGQVSFPGGAAEPQDRSLKETALRETEEEVGIPQNTIHILGQLDDFPTISNFLVTPFVATIPYPYPHNINPQEVARLLEVPLELFLSDRSFEMKEREYNGKKYPVFYYYFEDVVIWGVTGYIINRFVEQVFGYNPAPYSIHSDPNAQEYVAERLKDRSG